MSSTPHDSRVPLEKLRWRCDPDGLPYDSSALCPVCEDIIGQDRALKALLTGLDIKSLGYNIFITGMAGTGRTTTIKQLLERLEKGDRPPDDILYVNNFKHPDEPALLFLPPGAGKLFVAAMDDLLEVLKTNIPALLKSGYYTDKRDAIVEEQQAHQKSILQGFEEETAKQGFSVIQVQMGLFVKPDLIPVIDDQPTPFPKIEALVKEKKFPAERFEALKSSYETLSQKMEGIFERLREIEEETRVRLKNWDDESIAPIIKTAVSEIAGRFPHPGVAEFLAEAECSLADNIDLFKNQKKDEDKKEAPPADPLLEYRVNLLVDNGDLKHSPVIMETNPNYLNLFGSMESTMNRFGVLQTDFTKIKAGSFLKANGGYLVVNALDALVEQGVWATLKRTLRNQVFELQNYAGLFLFSSARLKPQPIKINVKLVMIGDEEIYNLLYAMDEDFRKVFKIKAEFDSEMAKTDDAVKDYIRFIRKIAEEDALLPFDRTGMAGIIEYGTRIAGQHKKLSTRFNVIADVIRESSFWAAKAGETVVARRHVDQAVEERFERVSLIEDKIQEMIEDGSILIDTDGAVVGQVNGLAVYNMGQFSFGKPARITARISVGRAGIINIEREADMSGSTHNKGVLILGGFLRGLFARRKPFALSASIAFEQSYSGIDGDSASSTEAYALLSALAGLPLRQDLAVTGSVNQKGEIQPIGGVNEKIEGFFDVCRAKGLTGAQGVLIPHQNVQNLMLRPDVVQAATEGRFHIFTVHTVDEGIEHLTGVAAGRTSEEGIFEPDSVYARVDKALTELARASKEYFEDKAEKKD
ncbi:MAG: ATP-binding protein [Acidobacteriota bacterium]|nr:ATP-binding protein [Acidobacteriota bacterium]